MRPDLREIVRKHGGDLYAGGKAATIPGPGHSRSDRSLSLRLTNDGDNGERVTFHSFANDSCREVMKYLGLEARHSQEVGREEWKRLRLLREAEERRRVAADNAFCASIWRATAPLQGSAAEAYLWSRSLIIDDCPDLRFHPQAPRAKPRPADDPRPPPAPHPAMVAIVRDRDRQPLGLHLTYVKADGTGKAFGAGRKSRLMFGRMRGGAVHLSPPGAALAVGEGIETCAAYRARTGLATWALLSTSQFASLQIPRGVRRLVIAADSGTGGMNAATALAERACKVCDVQIDPAPDGQDWADVWSAADV